MESAISNEIDGCSLGNDVICPAAGLRVVGANVKQKFRDVQIDGRRYSHTRGIDMPEICN